MVEVRAVVTDLVLLLVLRGDVANQPRANAGSDHQQQEHPAIPRQAPVMSHLRRRLRDTDERGIVSPFEVESIDCNLLQLCVNTVYRKLVDQLILGKACIGLHSELDVKPREEGHALRVTGQ
eukprot:CAMPEP_0115179974 /NCGR_PEP_ID=MMETSP0270-20121206/6681_1 /TAXON_ID=71861 /ORGANISM="Scrippsiella trochoidea, Strain CCMP3099" /LENGTH=121 /DNA_ID=CAMNT_0002592961 /DNA_START=166 /DNA_END=531 /DNA_ORIENTATION=+